MYLRIEAPDSSRYQVALRHTGRAARRAIRLAGVPTTDLTDGQLAELRQFISDRNAHRATPA